METVEKRAPTSFDVPPEGTDAARCWPMVRARRRASGRGFTLIELITVMTLVAVMSATAMPVLHRMTSTRERALADECARLLAYARGASLATGQPHGVKIDRIAGSLTMVRIESADSAPIAAVDAQGQPWQPMVIASMYGGAAVTGMINGDGYAGLDTVWFGFDGVPELRDDSGVRLGPFTSDATITTSGGHTILIRRLTGVIE